MTFEEFLRQQLKKLLQHPDIWRHLAEDFGLVPPGLGPAIIWQPGEHERVEAAGEIIRCEEWREETDDAV